jgi:beta-barrel assembly-enhancing protease
MKGNRLIRTAIILSFLLVTAGCAEVVKVGTTAGQEMGVITAKDKEIIDKTAKGAESAARPMTEKEEYFLGRAVAATILGTYKLEQNEKLTTYLNQVGQALAMVSDVPLTYGGYHFAILATDEVNALACPGGIIFVSRGMLTRAKNEEELASILAHEIAHVNHRDGIRAIQNARWLEVVTALGSDVAGTYGSGDIAKLTSLFEGSVSDVVKTLVTKGYSREQERAADQGGLVIMSRLGYDPNGMPDYLAALAKEEKAGGTKGFFSTHPGMADRVTAARETVTKNKWARSDHRARDGRFDTYL